MIISLLRNDPYRMKVLEQVRSLSLSDCWVAAGFIRNMVWDALHERPRSILNDIDVVFYDPSDKDHLLERNATERLNSMEPSANWEVTNQAFVHLCNGDVPYQSSGHAMSYWPEKETAVGARLNNNGEIELSAPFGVDSLLAGFLTYNPKREYPVFRHRVESKGWLKQWPNLQFKPQHIFSADAKAPSSVSAEEVKGTDLFSG